MDHNKKVNRAGAVCLPASLRRDYGIEPGTKCNITVSPTSGNIILKKSEGVCFFCDSNERLTIYKGRHICEECSLNIYEEAMNNVDRN